MIQAVVFDMDGTMFNTEDSFIAECMKIQESLGMKPDREMQLMAIGSHSDYIEAMMRERLKDGLYERYREKTREAFARIHAEHVELKPGLMELLDFLKAEGIQMGVATSTPQRVAQPSLEVTGVDQYLGSVVYGDMLPPGRGKPHPDIYLRVLEELGVAPQNALGVEDSHNGVRALRAAGMVTVMIPDLLPVTPEMHGLYDVLFGTLHEVIPYIKKLNGRG